MSCHWCAATVVAWERWHVSFWISLKIYWISELWGCSSPVVHFFGALFTACDVISSLTTATKWNIMKGCFVRCCFQEQEWPWSPRSAPKNNENWNFYFSLTSCTTLSANGACVIWGKAQKQLAKGTLLRKCCFQHQLITGVIHFVTIIVFIIVIAAIIAVTTVVIVLIIVIIFFNSHRQCN